MALGILAIIYIVIIIAIISSQILLYKTNTKLENEGIYFMLNIILIFILSYIVYTSLPTNYAIQKILSLVWSGLAALAFMIKINTNKTLMIAKIMLTIGIAGNLVQLII